ncbi:enoyl-CoA hydratase (plasmid) [Rhodococcus jostii RHA1]|uniref:Enoyl-CoA hydratase n=1 Tax=Rhodococcus jostii (strain RHA1) TaxID=101510 RepID=Q0RVS0_RHOJR|nr:enoyl-CoA hydratase/isomerase family protein [Rhodococcus jostii]ABH00616.1 enoyl-CoA hydratase [Rhodococcus jostii RHA1]
MITVDEHENIVVISIEHGKVNALDLELLAELSAVFRSLSTRADGAVIVTGVGSSFSAGVDLRRIQDGGREYILTFLPALSAAILDIFQCPLPVVAAINGHAIAGGCLLAAAADVRFMGRGRIGLPELAVGVPLPVAGIEVLRTAIGHHAYTMITNASTVAVDEADGYGLVTAVEPKELESRAMSEARRLADIPPHAFTTTKAQLHAPTMVAIEANAELDRAVTAGWVTSWNSGHISDYLASLSH